MKIKKLTLYFPLVFIILSILSVPIYGQGKLNIITSDGYIVSYGDFPSIDLPVKNFYFGDNDFIWVVDKKVKEIDSNFQPILNISKDGKELESDFVSGMKGEEIILKVIGGDNYTKVFCDYPQPLTRGEFRKKYEKPGTYLAVFRAEQGQEPNKLISHRIIKIIISESPAATYSLKINVNPPEAGTVTVSPPGGTYSAGTTVTLTAVPYSDYSFTGWSGDITENNYTLTITMNKHYNINANFQLKTTGEFTSKVLLASPVKKLVSDYIYTTDEFGIKRNGTLYFLIDPKNFGISWKSELISISIVNKYQYVPIYLAPKLYKLDANNNLIKEYIIYGTIDYRIIVNGFKKAEYDSGVKFLLEISEKGLGELNTGLIVRWHFN